MREWFRRTFNRSVPYYHHRFEASYFEGWSGYFIRVINWLRYRITRYMEYRIMLYVLHRVGFDDPWTVEAYRTGWAQEEGPQTRRPPLMGILGQFTDPDAPTFRYAEGRKNSPTAQEVARDIAQERNGSWARYMAGNKKPVYGTARDDLLIQDVDCEAVPRTEE